MTLDDAKNLRYGDILHYTGPNSRGQLQPCTRAVGPRGGVTTSIVQVRVSGTPKVWKRSPERVQVPYKYGLYDHGYITEDILEYYHRAIDCPLHPFNDHAGQE